MSEINRIAEEINKIAEEIQILYDDFIKNNSKKMEKIINHLDENKIEVKNYDNEVEINNLNQDSWGVYVFYIEPKIDIVGYDDFKKLWEIDHNGNTIKYIPRAKKYKKSCEKFKPLEREKERCFYVGKSQDLIQRIREHINSKTSESTYALKLSKQKKILENAVFKYSYFCLTKEKPKDKDSMNFLLEILEKKIRKELRPLIGKQ